MAEVGRFYGPQEVPWFRLLAFAVAAMMFVWRLIIEPFLSSRSSWFVRLGLLSFSSFALVFILVVLNLSDWLFSWQPFAWILRLILFDGVLAIGLVLSRVIVQREPPA